MKVLNILNIENRSLSILDTTPNVLQMSLVCFIASA